MVPKGTEEVDFLICCFKEGDGLKGFGTAANRDDFTTGGSGADGKDNSGFRSAALQSLGDGGELPQEGEGGVLQKILECSVVRGGRVKKRSPRTNYSGRICKARISYKGSLVLWLHDLRF